jgi:hypothetical protein
MDALYELRDGGVFATAYTRGPWDPQHQHGGAPAALMVRAFEQLDDNGGTLVISRVSYELVKPVPLGNLVVTAEVVRPGRRVQVLEGSIRTPDGTEVLKARAQRVLRAPVSAGGELSVERGAAEAAGGAVAPPPNWSTAEPSGFGAEQTMFPGDGMEIRFVEGAFFAAGPASAWFRLRVPVIAGETPSPLQRVAAACDYPNGISAELDWSRYVFINPDLTLYLEREPVGEWIALRAATRVLASGAGVAQAVLYDEQGRIGRSLQSLYVAERS